MSKTLSEELRERAYERNPVDGFLAVCAEALEVQTRQIDKFGLALMMIREGAADPCVVASEALEKFNKKGGQEAAAVLSEFSFTLLIAELESRKEFEVWLEDQALTSYEEGKHDGLAAARKDQEVSMSTDLAWLIARGETEEALDLLHSLEPKTFYPPLHYIRAVRKERAERGKVES